MSALLAALGLSVDLGGRRVVDDVSFAIAPGEFVALVGPNGAGKTTLLRAAVGLIDASGELTVAGKPAAQLGAAERARLLAYLPQGHAFAWPVTVAELVAIGRHPHADPFGGVSDADRAAVARALAATETTALADRSVATLSGGERARVALARALATDARILLADEPTASLDPKHQLVVMRQLADVAHRGGAVLAVVHDLALVARFADRVLVMQDGRIVADAAPTDALSPGRLAAVFGIEASVCEAGGARVPIAVRPLAAAQAQSPT